MKWRDSVIAWPLERELLLCICEEAEGTCVLEQRGSGMGTGEENAASFLLPMGWQELCCGSRSHLSLLRTMSQAVMSTQHLCVEVFPPCSKDLAGPWFFECMSMSSLPVPIALNL